MVRDAAIFVLGSASLGPLVVLGGWGRRRQHVDATAPPTVAATNTELEQADTMLGEPMVDGRGRPRPAVR